LENTEFLNQKNKKVTKLLSALGLYTYESYLKQFQEWVEQGKTSSKDASKELIEFTKLNFARTQRIHKTIVIDPLLKKSVESLQNNYMWMVITEAWCGDSAQNLPVIAEIAKLNTEKIKLYIIFRDPNPDLINNYLTSGSRAIPKLIAINETSSEEAFVWGPRPALAQELLKAWKINPEGKTWGDFEKELHGWYAKDKAVTLQSEFLTIINQLE